MGLIAIELVIGFIVLAAIVGIIVGFSFGGRASRPRKDSNERISGDSEQSIERG